MPRPSTAAALAGLLLLPVLSLGQSPATAASTDDPVHPDLAADPGVDPSITTSSGPTQLVVQYGATAAAGRTSEFDSPDQRQHRDELNRRVGAVPVRELRASAIQVVQLEDGMDVDAALRAYRRDPAVVVAEPNYGYSTDERANDPLVDQQWALSNAGQTGGLRDADIDAQAAWNVTTGRRSVVVVVIDTGIDYRHPDLKANVWTNPGEVPGDGRDNDHNGYVDDVHGYDAVDDDGDPADENGHGTHVAGTIGATGHNRIGVAGVSWRVRIAACRFLDAGGSGTLDGAIACLDYVKALRSSGVNVVATNNSWSGVNDSTLLRRAIRTQHRVLFVAAAGNDGADLDTRPAYPASLAAPNIISVAATDHTDRQARWSNYGRTSVSIGAPGSRIVSLRAAGTDMYGDGEHFVPAGDPDAEYYVASGTSMAAPHVTGVAALVRARYPHLEWSGIRNRIIAGGDPVASTEGTTVTGRRLNAYGALRCSGNRVFSVVGTPPTFPLPAGRRATFRLLNIDCADPGGPVRATTSTGARFTLRDDGRAPDVQRHDGLYAATFVPRRATASVTFSSGSQRATLPGITFGHYLPQAQVGADYHQPLRPYDGTAPYRWSLIDGALPDGLTLDKDTGVISGTPTAAGHSLPRLRLTDAVGRVAVGEIGLDVAADSMAETLLAVDRGDVEVVPVSHAVDGDGNTVVVGYHVDPRTHDEDFAITKYGPTGDRLWTRLRTSDTPWWANWARAVTVDDSGNIYVAGGYPYFRADSDFVLLKLDADGNELWATSYSDLAIELPSGIAIDPVGDIVVTGTSTTSDTSSVLTVKLHPSGTLVWARKFREGVLDRGSDVGIDAAGNIYVAGGSGSVFDVSGDLTTYTYGYLVLKYTPTGDLEWSRIEHDPAARRLQLADAIAVDPAGNSYLGGPLGGSLEKYSSDGTLEWSSVVTTEHNFDVRDVALASDGDIVVAGSYFDFDEQRWVNSLASVDSTGAPQWVRRLDGEFMDDGLDVTVDQSDLIRVTLPSDRGVVLTSFRATLEIATSELMPALRGEDYHQKLRAKGGVRPITWELSSGSLPAGVTLDAATGVLAGIPTEGGSSTFTVTVTAADGVTVSREYTLDVAYVAIDPVVWPTALRVGEPMQKQLAARGSAPPFTWGVVSGELPPGVTVNAATGLLSGTPTSAGTFAATIGATDADGHTGSLTHTFLVVEPLTILTASLPDAVAGSAYSTTLQLSGGQAPYSWGWSGTPVPGLQLAMETGELSGVPTTPGVYDTGVFVFDTLGNVAFQPLTLVVH